MGLLVLRIIACLVVLMIYRMILYIAIHKDEFEEYLKSDNQLFGLVSLLDFKWILLNQDSDNKPIDEYVKADAKVVDRKSTVYESYDEKGNLLKETHYTLKIKFYAGNQCVTTSVDSDKNDENVEVCYNVKNPYEVYLADDKRFGNLSKNERIENTFSTLWATLGYVVAAIVIFYPLFT